MNVVLPVSRGPKSATLVCPFKISDTWFANASMPTILDGSSTGRSQTNGFNALGIETHCTGLPGQNCTAGAIPIPSGRSHRTETGSTIAPAREPDAQALSQGDQTSSDELAARRISGSGCARA